MSHDQDKEMAKDPTASVQWSTGGWCAGLCKIVLLLEKHILYYSFDLCKFQRYPVCLHICVCMHVYMKMKLNFAYWSVETTSLDRNNFRIFADFSLHHWEKKMSFKENLAFKSKYVGIPDSFMNIM